MQLKKGQIVELEIDSMAFGGTGIGRYEGLAVFVPRTVPGDKVKASFRRIKPNFAEAELVEVVEESEQRIKPRCEYFGVCGGCQFQFLSYEDQLHYKKQHVIDALERIGGFESPPVREVLGCEDPFYYRNKMEFSFGYDAEMEFALGLHLPGRRYDILDLKNCYLESELSAEILNEVRAFALEKGWLPRKYSTGEGFVKSLTIREGKRTGELMVVLMTTKEYPEDFENDLNEFVERLRALGEERKITSIYWSVKVAERGKPTTIKENLLWGKKTLTEKMRLENGDELEFQILPQAFFQPNTLQAEILYSQVAAFALKKPQSLVFDLFCGTGTIGLFLANYVEKVMGIELNPDSIEVARENAQANNIFNIDFYVGNASTVLEDVKERPSLVVVDPPRAGLTEKLIEQINEYGCDQVVYVSCNPSTFARDLKQFGEFGFKLKEVQPVDMFPHTYHIENVALLER